MHASLPAIVALASANTAPKWHEYAAVPISIGSIGAVPYRLSATRERACWRWDWLRARTVPTEPVGPSPATGQGTFCFLFSMNQALPRSLAPSPFIDGMKLTGLWISAVVRCAPPANKPTPEEQRNCAPWLDQEMSLLEDLRVVVCLGRVAFDGLLTHAQRTGRLPSRSSLIFAHGVEHTLPGGLIVLASYHPSLQNTNTGKLTRPMFLSIFKRARKLASLP